MIKFIKNCILTVVAIVVIFVGYCIFSGRELPSTEELKALGNEAGDKVQKELEKVDYQIETNTIFDENREFIKGDGQMVTIGQDASEMSLELGGFAVEIKPSEEGNYSIQVDGNGKVQAYIEDATLYVKAVKTVSDQEESLSSKIVLYLPKSNQFEEVSAKLGAGLLNLGDLSAEQLKIELGAGQIKGKGNVVNQLDANVGMGAILLDEVSIHQLKAQVGMGALQLEGDILETADLECAMGNIKLTLAGEEKDFNYDLEGAAGNVTIGTEKYSGMTQEKNLYNGAVKDIDIECAMGNVTVAFE